MAFFIGFKFLCDAKIEVFYKKKYSIYNDKRIILLREDNSIFSNSKLIDYQHKISNTYFNDTKEANCNRIFA